MVVRATAGRRESHKVATRHALMEAAGSLFLVSGYTKTTVAEIAAAAGVSERTFYRYFDSKEELLLPDLLRLLGRFDRSIEIRPISEPPFTAILTALLEVTQDLSLASVSFLTPRYDHLNASLNLRILRTFVEWEEHLSNQLVERIRRNPEFEDVEDPELFALVIARCAISASRSAFSTYRDRTLEGSNGSVTIGDLLKRSFAYAEMGFHQTTQ